ncbi:MAG TPA: GAF domain-containing protein [Anaeromyxobacter sp.]
MEVSVDAEQLQVARALGFRSAMIVPMSTRDRTLGAITFVAAESGRRYGPADLLMAEELGRRAGLAVENARLYEAWTPGSSHPQRGSLQPLRVAPDAR